MIYYLPPEIREEIFKYLSFSQIIKCTQINWDFKNMIDQFLGYHKYRKTLTDAFIFSVKNDDYDSIDKFNQKYKSTDHIIEIMMTYGSLDMVKRYWILWNSKMLSFLDENKESYWNLIDRLDVSFLEWNRMNKNNFIQIHQFKFRNQNVIEWFATNGIYCDKISDEYLFKLGLNELAKKLIENNLIPLENPHYLLTLYDQNTVDWCLKYATKRSNFLSNNVHPEVIRYLIVNGNKCTREYMHCACEYGLEDAINILALREPIDAYKLFNNKHYDLLIKYIENGVLSYKENYSYVIQIDRMDIVIKMTPKKSYYNEKIFEMLIKFKKYDTIRELISKKVDYGYYYNIKCAELIDVLVEKYPERGNNNLILLIKHGDLDLLKKWFPKIRSDISEFKLKNQTPDVVVFLLENGILPSRDCYYYIKNHINHVNLVIAYISSTGVYDILDQCSDDTFIDIMRKIFVPSKYQTYWTRYDQLVSN